MFDRKLVESVAHEMNKVMKMDPPIEIAKLDDAILLDTIVLEARGGADHNPKWMLRSTDEFSAEAWKFFISAGVWDEDKKCVIVPGTAATAEAKQPEQKKQAAKKGEKKMASASSHKKATASKKSVAKKVAPAEVFDAFGFRKGTASSNAMTMFTTGRYTMAEAMKKLGTKTGYNYALAKAKKKGHKVTIAEDGKITVK